LTRKAGELLRCLLDRAGMLVTHDAILATVWPDTHVQPENVKVLIRELRLALGDDPRHPRFIRSEPARGYTFIAETADASPRSVERSMSGVPDVFIDRRHELGVLTESLRAAAEFQCRLVLVEGERRMGKTSLCDAFLDVVRRQPNTRFAYGQCIEHLGISEPYLPLFEALSHLSRQFSVELQTTLATQAPDWLAGLPRWARVGLPAWPESPVPEGRLRMTRELIAAFEELSEQGTTVLMLEDLQWGDLDTIEVLRAIGRHHSPLRLLVVATVAPFARGEAGRLVRQLAIELQASPGCVRMALRPFSQASVGDYLAARFETDSLNRLARPLYAVTRGHPFYVVSALDAMVARGHIRWRADGWHLVLSTRMLEAVLSACLVETMSWQADQLEVEDRRLLEAAAAVGVEFTLMEVTTALGDPGMHALGHRLDQLVDRGFILRSGGWTGPRVTYRFPHACYADSLLRHAPPLRQLGTSSRVTRLG
jgi:predicted ATPase